MATKITGKPTKKVSNLSISKENDTNKLTAKWKAGTQLTTPTSPRRATKFKIQWVVSCVNSSGKAKTITRTKTTSTTGTTTSTLNLDNFTVTSGSGSKKTTTTYKRSSFYPVTDLKVTKATCKVYGVNSKPGTGPAASRTYDIKSPGAPTVSDLTQAEETGHICFEITPYDCSKNANERYRTEYRIVKNRREPDVEGRLVDTTSTESGSFTGSAKAVWEDTDETGKRHVDVEDRYAVGYDGYVEVKVTARSSGFSGDSGWTAEKRIVVSFPAKPKVETPIIDSTSIQNTGMVTIPVDTNQKGELATYHPVTGLRLQKLVSTTATTPAQAISRGSEWEDTEIVDDGHCEALSISVADLSPTRGTHTWVRVKCWNQFEDKFFRYSDPVEVTDLYLDPEAVGGTVEIKSLISGSDGTSLIADLEWVETGDIPSTGTELSWSADQNAWRSTEEPKTFEFDASKGIDEEGGPDDDYDGKAQVYIQGLTQGTTYYVKARRYYDGDDGERTYGAYSTVMSAVPTSSPTAVVLSAPAFVARGSDVYLTWTFDSTAEQTEWKLLAGQTTVDAGSEEEQAPREWDGETVVAMEGTDSAGSCVLSAERYEPLLQDNQLSLSVRVGTGGVPVESEPVVFRVVDPPTVTATVPATLTAQPLHVSLESNVRARVTAVVRAAEGGNGGNDETPGRNRDQAEGDVVWQVASIPPWTGDGPYTATLDSPVTPPLDLLDNGSYIVTVSALDEETGLSSAPVEARFSVAWEHQAPAPDPDRVIVTPYDRIDAEGNRVRGCTVQLYDPDGSAATDVWDVYRLTPDGPYPIAEGLSLEAMVDDPYAPYGGEETGYRVCTRTTDGDLDWADVMFHAQGKDLRIDFDGGYVELPWDLSLSDSYEKDFEARRKLDGSIDGYWNDGVMRTGGFTTDLIRVTEQDVAAAVRRLGRHVGPAFVRTPDGCAYQADVQVSDMSGARRDAALAVTLDVTEMDLTDEYRAVLTDEEVGTGEDDG